MNRIESNNNRVSEPAAPPEAAGAGWGVLAAVGAKGGAPTLQVSGVGAKTAPAAPTGAPPVIESPSLEFGLQLQSFDKIIQILREKSKIDYKANMDSISKSFAESLEKMKKAHEAASKGGFFKKLTGFMNKIGMGAVAAMVVMAIGAFVLGAVSGGTAAVMAVGLLSAAATMILDETGQTKKFQEAVQDGLMDIGMSAKDAGILGGVIVGATYMAGSIAAGVGAGAAVKNLTGMMQTMQTAEAAAKSATTLADDTAALAVKASDIGIRINKIPLVKNDAALRVQGHVPIASRVTDLVKQANTAATSAQNMAKMADDAVTIATQAVDKATKAAAQVKILQATLNAQKATGATQQELAAAKTAADALKTEASALARVANQLTSAAERSNKTAYEVARNAVKELNAAERGLGASSTVSKAQVINELDLAVASGANTLDSLQKLAGAANRGLISLQAGTESMGGKVSSTRMAETLKTAQTTADDLATQANMAYLKSSNWHHVGTTITRVSMAVDSGTKVVQAAGTIATAQINYTVAQLRADAQKLEALIKLKQETQKFLQEYMEATVNFSRDITSTISEMLSKAAEAQKKLAENHV